MRKSAAPSRNPLILTKSIFAETGFKRSISDVLTLVNAKDKSNQTENKNIVENPLKKTVLLENNGRKVLTESKEQASKINNCNSGQTFKVVWGKPSTKKHKTWEGDGLVVLTDKSATLHNEEGSVLGTKQLLKPLQLEMGQIIMIGSKEVQIIEPADDMDIASAKKRPVENTSPVRRPNKIRKKLPTLDMPQTGFSTRGSFSSNHGDALLLPAPPTEHQWKHNKTNRPLVDVRLEPFLSRTLRPHQREGLHFLYRCVMGYNHQYTGAILADEMGLGKTLQCIVLIWVLLKHGPYGHTVIRRALVITPSTLCANWRKEFLKWLGRERLMPFLVDNTNKPQNFLSRPGNCVMIISYERFVKHASEIEAMNFGLVICDEAHRLKNANIKAAQSLKNLSCIKRVLLTGTPIQNDLQEYFALLDVVNPGILGTYSNFKENFEDPILKSQKPECSEEEKLIGEEGSSKLQLLTSSFILRRTQNILESFLPSKTECVVCCKMTNVQEKLYAAVAQKWWGNPETPSSSPLTMIINLKKICNHPYLIKNITDPEDEENPLSINNDMIIEHSGKLLVLKALLDEVVTEKKEKIVIVSCSTQLLDILAEMCRQLSFISVRLDGATAVSQRQSVVESFNRAGGAPVLLLSTRAGGAGLSLPAASRLVLYDSDWNPAVDRQAMARVWRDGQRRPVFIYRFLTTGTIEEKIYQRQMYKTGLSDATLDPNSVKSTLKLSTAELKDLFTTGADTLSSTHDMLQCPCSGDGSTYCVNDSTEEMVDVENQVCGQLGVSSTPAFISSINQLKSWGHFGEPLNTPLLEELGLLRAIEVISFIFHKTHIQSNNKDI